MTENELLYILADQNKKMLDAITQLNQKIDVLASLIAGINFDTAIFGMSNSTKFVEVTEYAAEREKVIKMFQAELMKMGEEELRKVDENK